jgi:plastocyanin domain-containing protein
MKTAAISIILSSLLVGGLIVISSGKKTESGASVNNVEIVEGKQIITIRAKGGYSPKVSTAAADTPTLIRVETTGTFDCSAALVLPSINYQSNLNPSGTTDIEIGPQKAGTKFQGLCSMGMYNFVVNFI